VQTVARLLNRRKNAATSRQFPGHMRADVQAAIDRLFSAFGEFDCLGYRSLGADNGGAGSN
jgi:hypothetical protein